MEGFLEIGRGKDGIVYQVDSSTVAKKFFSKKEFEKEKLALKFHHPNIARPLKINSKELIVHYPYYRKFDSIKKWTLQTRLKLLMQITDALCQIQKKGFLYTDVSPNNIMVDHEGDFILIDFGSLQKINDIKGIYANEDYKPIIEKSKCKDNMASQPFELTVPALLLYETVKRTGSVPDALKQWMELECPTVFALRFFLSECMPIKNQRMLTMIKLFDIKYRVGFFGEDISLTPEDKKIYDRFIE